MPAVAHRGVEAVVGHHRHGDAVAGQPPGVAQVQGGQRDQLVAVDDGAVAVDGQHAVAVAVEGEAEVVAARDDRLGERVDVGRAAAVVDVAPVGLVGDRRSPSRRGGGRSRARRGRSRRWRSRAATSTPAEVEALRSACAARAGSPRACRAARGRGRCVARPSRALGRRARASIAASVASESLKPSAPKNLIPLSLVGVVRGARARRRGRSRSGASSSGAAGRGQDAAEQHVAAGRGDAGGERRLEHLARLARVADDQDLRRAVALAQLRRRGAAEREREVGREQLAGDAADAVGSEELAAPWAASAWRTAGACGPS